MSQVALCFEAAENAKLPAMKHLLLFKIATSFLGVLATLVLLVFKHWKWLVNCNAKVLFILHVLFSLLLSASYFFVYCWDFHRITQASINPCDFLIQSDWALFTRLIPVIGLIGGIVSMFLLALERAYSTYKKASYENDNNRICSILLTILIIISSIGVPYFLLISGEDLSQMMTTYTMLTQTNRFKFQLIVNLETAIELSTIIIFLIVYCLNKRHRRQAKVAPLTTSYQVAENVKVTGRLLPIYVIHTVFLVLNSFGLAIFTAFVPLSDANTHKILLECVGQVHLYTIVMPIAIFARPLCRKKHTIAPNNQAVKMYFGELAKQWK